MLDIIFSQWYRIYVVNRGFVSEQDSKAAIVRQMDRYCYHYNHNNTLLRQITWVYVINRIAAKSWCVPGHSLWLRGVLLESVCLALYLFSPIHVLPNSIWFYNLYVLMLLYVNTSLPIVHFEYVFMCIYVCVLFVLLKYINT